MIVNFILSSAAFAGFDMNVIKTKQNEDDPGNIIEQSIVNIEYKNLLFKAADSSYFVTIGGAIETTTWNFDSTKIDSLNFMKVKFPISTTMVLSNKKLFTATLIPGIHGDRDKISDGEARLEGQAMTIIPSGNHSWVLGAGFGDSFGETKFYPVIGSIWKVSNDLELNLVLPSLSATYNSSPTTKWLASIGPAGGSWQLTPENYPGIAGVADITVSGIRTGIGAAFEVAKNNWFTIKAGVDSGRNINIASHANPSNEADLDLKNQWFVLLGYSSK